MPSKELLSCSYSVSDLNDVPANTMLVMAWSLWNSVGAWHWLRTQKIQLRSICLHYQQYLTLKRHFLNFLNNATGIIIFILCCISAYIPKTDAEPEPWTAIMHDLGLIENIRESIDASLYTAYTDKPDECEVQVMECFFLELKVIFQECQVIKGCKIQQHVRNVLKNVKSLSNNKSSHYSLSRNKRPCKQCEEYEEKNFRAFIDGFKTFVQRKMKN